MILKKDRAQAISVLALALRSEKPNSREFKELRKSLNEISRIFISEKNQQTYELSLSLKKTDPNQALAKINEAILMEPENFTLLLEAARQNLTKGDCKAALAGAQKTQKLNSLDEELNLVMAQIKICQNDLLGYATIKEAAPVSNALFWWSLEVEKNLKEKNSMKAKEALSQVRKIDKNYPEQHYWAWKIDNEQKIINLESAQKYKNECQNLKVTFYRKFILDPRLCSRISEVEAFIKSQPQNP